MHPAGLLADGRTVGIARIEHIDVIAALLLQIARQIGTVLGNPRLERHALEVVVRFADLAGTRGQKERSGRHEADATHQGSHIRIGFHSTLLTVKKMAIGLSRGTRLKFSFP